VHTILSLNLSYMCKRLQDPSKKVVITKSSIRHDLKLNDAEGIYDNPSITKKVFTNMKRVGTGFSGVITSLFDTMMVQPVLPTADQDTPIPDAPSSSQPQRKHKPKKKEKNERKETEISSTELPIEELEPTPFNDLLPSEMKSSHKAKITELKSRVEKLKEQNMSFSKELKSFNSKELKSFNSKVDSLTYKKTVKDNEKSYEHGRKIADINADAEEMIEVITTAKIIIDKVSTTGGELNAVDKEPVSDAPININIAQPSEATKTTVDITAAHNAKGIFFHDVEESTTRTASSKEQVKDKGKAKLVKEPKVLKSRKAHIEIDAEVARRIEAEWNADMQDNIDWNEVVKQNMARFKMKFFKGMSYEEIRPLFEEEYNKVQTLFKEGPEMDAERIKAPRKENVKKDQTAKKQKGDELKKENAKKQKLEEQQEAEEVKRNLEMVHDDEDDVFVNVAPLYSKPLTIVDYKIYKEGKSTFK
nr:hypothetical protein [Tanacetum cinerariifolium]